ncbi:MAG: alpha/beta hydrolase [Anaerolineales bacterium]
MIVQLPLEDIKAYPTHRPNSSISMAEIRLEPGLTIHYQDFNPLGSPTIVLLHGLGASGDSWQLQIPALTGEGYRVIVPDMRGFGKSTYPGGGNNPSIMAQDLICLMQLLRQEKFHLVGISLGGTVALQIVLTRPDLVKSLLITNCFAKLRPKRLSLWFFYGIRLILVHLSGIETQAKYVSNRLFPDPGQKVLREKFREQVNQSNPRGYRSTMRSLASFDASSRVGEIQTPTLVITGGRDTVVPPASQVELAKLIPDAQHIFIQDAGHAVTVEKPDQYNPVILEFLQNYN